MKRWLGVLCAFCVLAAAPLHAANIVDLNTADRAQLESVRGIGPHMADVILKERNRGGVFASADDFAARVPGIGPKRAENLRAAGLRIGTSASVGSAKRARGSEKNAAPLAAAQANTHMQKPTEATTKSPAASTTTSSNSAPAAPARP